MPHLYSAEFIANTGRVEQIKLAPNFRNQSEAGHEIYAGANFTLFFEPHAYRLA